MTKGNIMYYNFRSICEIFEINKDLRGFTPRNVNLHRIYRKVISDLRIPSQKSSDLRISDTMSYFPPGSCLLLLPSPVRDQVV